MNNKNKILMWTTKASRHHLSGRLDLERGCLCAYPLFSFDYFHLSPPQGRYRQETRSHYTAGVPENHLVSHTGSQRQYGFNRESRYSPRKSTATREHYQTPAKSHALSKDVKEDIGTCHLVSQREAFIPVFLIENIARDSTFKPFSHQHRE